MLELSGIGVAAAFFAGIISFLSPCVLPLVPGYISYVAGGTAAANDNWSAKDTHLPTIALSLCFVLGFSTVFIIMGATASALGQMLLSYRFQLNIVGGSVVILFGVFMLGFARFELMQRDFRFHLSIPGGRPLSAYVLGLAFGFGWTPCIGPILGAILTASAATTSVNGGIVLLSIYSLGLGVPFLLSAVFIGKLARRAKALGRIGRHLQQFGGLVLIVMGIAMVTGYLSAFAYWLLDVFPILGTIG